jgi:hypothetical protein
MKTLPILLFVFIAQTGTAQITENDLKTMNLKSNVTFLIEHTFRASEKEGKPEKGSLKSKSEYIFNLKGNLVETKYFDDKENLRGKASFVYDEQGNLTEENNYKADGYRFGSTYYKPDVVNKKREKSRSFSDGTKIDKSIQLFNTQKKLIEVQIFSGADNKLSVKEERKYDAKGNLTKVIRSSEQFGVMSETTYQYDDKGNPIEEIIYSFKTKSSEVEHTEKMFYTYTYDAKGNWISKACYEIDNKNITSIIEREITY